MYDEPSLFHSSLFGEAQLAASVRGNPEGGLGRLEYGQQIVAAGFARRTLDFAVDAIVPAGRLCGNASWA